METLGYIIIAAIHAALTSYFLHCAYRPGHIFARYYDWLANGFAKEQRWAVAFAKPLGLCVYCQNVWVTFVITALYAVASILPWWTMLVVPVVSHYIITYIIWQHNANEQ